MKLLATLLLVSQATAFTVVPSGAVHETRLFAGDYVPLEGEAKINLKVDLDSPKVATMDTIEKGKKVYCRCWLSGTFPLCDGKF
jgi:nitrous oxidase accessory protein NosD